MKEMTLDDLITLHKGLLKKTPFWQRKTKDRLKHAIADFELWKQDEEQQAAASEAAFAAAKEAQEERRVGYT